MKTAFVVPGRSPVWIQDQVRYEANRLTDDGRVLIAFTHRPDVGVRLPGQVGESTLFGIAPNGYPLWTGRATAALGMRRRHDRVVIVMFDGAVTGLAIAAALIAKLSPSPAGYQYMRVDTDILLVGIGTRYGSGCTSGHGVCGLSRLSPRSLVATLSFMGAGFVTVFVLRHLLPL